MLSNFAALEKHEPPCRTSLRGITKEVSDLETTNQGNEKRAFKLVGNGGLWVPCTAIGPMATSSALQEDKEILVFFANCRGGSSSTSACILLFQDSYIVPIKSLGANKVTMTREVQLES